MIDGRMSLVRAAVDLTFVQVEAIVRAVLGNIQAHARELVGDGVAAGVLSVSPQQTQRLLARYEDGGGAALIHKARLQNDS